MIAGLCESPLTFQAVIIWRDELMNAKILLRDIIDLEATYEGPEAKAAPPADRAHRCQPGAPARLPRHANGEDLNGDGERAPPRASWTDDEDDYRERALARRHGSRAQAQGARDLRQRSPPPTEAAQAAGQESRDAGCERAVQSPAAERPTTSSATRSSGYVKSLSLNNARIESLVEQLYGINKQLVALGEPA